MSFRFLLLRSRRFFALYLLSALLCGCAVVGCGRFAPHAARQYVYVSAKEMFLRERLAAVSRRTADVKNGDRLEVVARDRHFFQVKTAQGAVGWVDDRSVIDQPTYDEFEALRKNNAQGPGVASGVLRFESNVHLTPGRDAVHFYLFPANTKVELVRRASVPKALPAQAVPVPVPLAAKKKPAKVKKEKRDPNAPPYVPEGPPMEDWWLVRGPNGETGWVLSQMLDINIPPQMAGLVGVQRYVAVYQIRTVEDPESKFADGLVPEYVALTNAWKEGLPYDFDQVHVFTWDIKHHRYELAFRDRGIEGYLPLKIGSGVFDGKTEPTFSWEQATDNQDVVIDAATGAARAGHTETVTYRLEGSLVRQVGAPAAKPGTEAPRRAARRLRGRRHGRS